MSDVRNGFLIAVEGPDGAGKSTVIKTIEEWLALNHKPGLITRELGGTPFAERIRNLLLAPVTPECSEEPTMLVELMLAWASRFQHLEKKIKPALIDGKIVVTDRYYWSTRAYQVARGAPAGLERFFEDYANIQFEKFFLPDLVIYLDVSFDTALERLAKRTDKVDRLDEIETQKKRDVYQSYCKSVSDIQTRSVDEAFHVDLEVVNAEQDQEAVQRDVIKILDNYFHINTKKNLMQSIDSMLKGTTDEQA